MPPWSVQERLVERASVRVRSSGFDGSHKEIQGAAQSSSETEGRAGLGADTALAWREMFDISCGDDSNPTGCGIFGGAGAGGGSKQPQTLQGLLQKLDLSEYEPKFVAAGITDVP